jgi:hypothetical protein
MKCARCGHVWRAFAPPAAPAAAQANPAPAAAQANTPPAAAQANTPPAAAQANTPPAAAQANTPPAATPARPAPAVAREEIPLEAPPAEALRATLPRDEVTERMFAEHDLEGDLALAEIDARGFAGEGADRLADEPDPFAEMSSLMRGRRPESESEPMPPPVRKAPRRKGGLILWILALFLLLAASASGLYFYQDRLIDRWPALGKYYDMAGARRDEVGAGLSFRNYNSERLVQDNNEVLIVRGVIANNTAQKHDIPLLRLALYNGQALLQEKIITPPQPALDANGTVGFRVTLDQPDVNATRFEVTFTAPKPGGP